MKVETTTQKYLTQVQDTSFATCNVTVFDLEKGIHVTKHSSILKSPKAIEACKLELGKHL